MDTKKPSEALKAFKQCNKTAREVRAKRLGYADAATYISYLEGLIKKGDKPFKAPSSSVKTGSPTPSTTKASSTDGGEPMQTSSKKSSSKSTPVQKVKSTKTTKTTPVIHVVDVLDSSGSMSGGKYTAALNGINSGVRDLKGSTVKVDYTYSLVDFSTDIRIPYLKVKLFGVSHVTGETRSSTALFDAIGTAVDKVSKGLSTEDKVLVNIYTDGQENASKEYGSKDISNLIKEYSKKGWTFTFIGTPDDVAYASRVLSIHSSNTMTYDGTAAGLSKTLTATRSARTTYANSVSRGEDVSTGFYKNIETDSKTKKSK